MNKKHCIEHSATREFIDSFTDEQIAELWFSPINGCSGEMCSEDKMIEVYEKAHALALVIMEALPNRAERLMSLNRLQECCMHACAGMRRNHAVNNILQAKQGRRDLSEMTLKRCTDENDPDAV